MISPEDYIKTAAAIPEPGLVQKALSYIKANPWKSGLTATGLAGAGALGAHFLGSNAAPKEAPIGMGLPEMAAAGLERGIGGGIGGAITEGAKVLGRAAYMGGRRLFQGRRQTQIFNQIVQQDPILSEADPEVLRQSFATMARFAPTLASDPYAAQSFLREAVTTGGGINYNTIKLLAEAERASQQA